MEELQAVLNQITGFDYVPLVLALVLGGVIGLERELHGRPAGLRTHMLVCLCSAMLINASKQLVMGVDVEPGTTVVFDPNRLSAGIVTGIGFLGAAAVVRSGDMVRGLTTGASVWCVAGLGVVIGQGAYAAAVLMTAAAIFILVVLDMLPGSLGAVLYRRLKVTGSTPDMSSVSDKVQRLLRSQRVRVQEIAGNVRGADGEQFELQFSVRCRGTMQAPLILKEVADMQGVVAAAWSSPHR